MKHLLLLSLAALSLSQFPEDGGVLVLTDQTIHQALQKYEFLMIDFYAHWCGHCIHLAPVYAAVARQLRSSNLQFAKINCAEYQQLCRSFGIGAFPTLKLYEKGQFLQECEHERTEKGILEWVRKRTNRGSIEAKSLDQIRRFTETSTLSIVFFGNQENSIEFQQYSGYTRKNKNVAALHTFNQNYANEMRAEVPSIVVFKQFDERRASLSDDFSLEAIDQFVKKHSYPILMPFDLLHAKRIFSGEQPTLFLIQNSQKSHSEKYLRLALSKIKDKILICLANTDTRYGLRLMQYFRIQPEYLPQVVAYNPANDKFNLLSDINKDNIIKFTQDFLGINQRTDL